MLSVVFALCLVTATAVVPRFTLDLDAPEEDRWAPIVEHYKEELPGMMKAWGSALANYLGKYRTKEWLHAIKIDNEYMRELRGIVKHANHSEVTVDRLILWNHIYELHHPTFCSGYLMAMPNGTVVHGRNMDYMFLFTVNGSARNWPSVTFDLEFIKDGKPLFVTTGWPGHIGTHTAMRHDGWTFEQNTRMNIDNDDPAQNLIAMRDNGGQGYFLVARRILERVPDFETAVRTIKHSNFAAPQFFIMSGAGPWEGAVITIDRNNKHQPTTPAVHRLSQKNRGWYMVQTNWDANKLQGDPRKPMADGILAKTSQRAVNEDFMLAQMRTFPTFNPLTVFTTVWVAALNRQTTLLPMQKPPTAAPTAAPVKLHMNRKKWPL